MTWPDAQQFCASNGLRTLPILTYSANDAYFRHFVRHLPHQLHRCSAWLALHTVEIAAEQWRWVDNSAEGK